MSGQSPSENLPSQPPKQEAYQQHTAPNPITRSLSEFAVADTPGTPSTEGAGSNHMSYHPDQTSSSRIARTPFDKAGEDKSIPNPLEWGVRGGKPASERERKETHYAAEGGATKQNENEDAEQMATYAEGKVAHAVERTRRRDTSGGPHGRVRSEVSLEGQEGDLERKKAQ